MMKKRPSWKGVEGHPRIYKRGDWYGIKYQKDTGIYGKRTTTFETKIATLQEAIGKDKEIQRKQAPGQKTYSEQTFGYFLKNKFAKIHFSEIRKNTQLTYTSTIHHLLSTPIGEKKIQEIDPNDILFFREYLLSRNLSIGTINGYLDSLNMILGKAVEWGDIPQNTMPKKYKLKKQKKEKKELNPAELKEIIERQNKEIHKRMCYVSLFSGMRCGEIAGFKWSDIDFEKNTIRIQRQITQWEKDDAPPKTDTGIYSAFEMLQELAEKLQECREYTGNEVYVFPGWNGHTVSVIIDGYKLRCARKGIDPLLIKGQGFHFFRHSFGSLLYAKTHNIAYVSKMMRHADVTMTMNEYVHLIKGDIENYTKGIRFYD